LIDTEKAMAEYLAHNKFFAQVSGSLEKVASSELEELGAKIIREVPRGLYFTCDKAVLYRVLYESRIIQRVLAPLFSFACHSEKYLYQQAFSKISWTELFRLDESFAIEANVSDSKIKHSLYASQILKDAICDAFRTKYDKRPDFDAQRPDLSFNLWIFKDMATIALDIGGGSMHKRGYRSQGNLAPLQETLAAAMLRLSAWKGETALIDPMCGSGTLLAEALMLYSNIPASYLRENKGILHMPDFDGTLWQATQTAANDKIRPLPTDLIYGNDISATAIDAARSNLAHLPFSSSITLSNRDFVQLSPPPSSILLSNLPYGKRIGSDSDIAILYNSFGKWLRSHCSASTAYILCGSDHLCSELRLRHRWKKTLKNADIESCFAMFIIK